MRSFRRQVAVVLLGVTLALAVIVVRLLVDARTAYRNGAAAEARGEVSEAIRFYLDAGRLYVPGSPFTRGALDRLDALGVALVTKGDYATARMAFEAGWTADGAVCVNHARVKDNISLGDIEARWPRLAGRTGVVCTEAAARSLGAVLFNRSLP